MALVRKMNFGDRLAVVDTETGEVLLETLYYGFPIGRIIDLCPGVRVEGKPDRRAAFMAVPERRIRITPRPVGEP